MPITGTNLSQYIERLRLHLGDTDSTSYRYMDSWLETSLVASVEALMPRWNYKYIFDGNDVKRNPNSSQFIFQSPPIIERGDVRPIILMASIIIKEGSLESSSWNFGSWRDAEISYSNIEGSRAKDASLRRDIDELNSILPERTKRLAQPKKGHLPGYLNNPYEHD